MAVGALIGAVTAEAVHVAGTVGIALPFALAAAVAIVRDARVAFGVLTLLVVVLGSELYVGPIRLVDAAAFLSLVGAAVDSQARPIFRRPGLPQALIASLIALSAVVAFADAVPLSLSHTDLHDALVPVAIYVTILRTVRRVGAPAVLTFLIAAAVLASLKAIAIAVLPGGTALGVSSLLQANVNQTALGSKRVILIGGDTVIALAPALCIAVRRLPALSHNRWVAAFLITAIGTAITVTRTNIIAATVAIVVAVAIEGLGTVGTGEFRRLAMGCLVAVVALVGSSFIINVNGQSVAGSVVSRFSSTSNIAYSLTYRSNEAARLLDTVRGHEVFGLGAGATFFTEIPETVNGDTFATYGRTLWAHDGYLWILLKTGLVGVAIFILAMGLTVFRLLAGPRSVLARAGLVSIAGVLVLSYTTNRFDDIGAGLLLGLAFVALTEETDSGGEDRILDVSAG
jgi:hypothetical protein